LIPHGYDDVAWGVYGIFLGKMRAFKPLNRIAMKQVHRLPLLRGPLLEHKPDLVVADNLIQGPFVLDLSVGVQQQEQIVGKLDVFPSARVGAKPRDKHERAAVGSLLNIMMNREMFLPQRIPLPREAK